MSSPAQGGPSVPKEEKRESVRSKMLTRMKTVLKKAEKRMSITGSSKAGPSASAVKSSEPTPVVETAKPAEESGVQATKVPRAQIYEERARKLGERFGLEIKPSEWHSTQGDALRVEKPIRMRVHRTCHMCNSTFGTSKLCPKCDHPRCKECTRYPPRRTEAEKVASREKRAQMLKERAENAPLVVDWNPSEKKVVLRRPNKAGGQDLVYKKPRQRVRRTCCQCACLFQRGNLACAGCDHKRCTDCPRDPAKKKYYPYGYPGDEFGAGAIVRHQCHECETKFPEMAADGTECSKCSHAKCSECPRLKPHRVEPEPDPEVMKILQVRLAKMKVG